MRRSLAIVPVLVLVLSATSAVAGLECLNSKPCGTICIARDKVCHPPPPPPHCRQGYYHCGKACIPNRDLCALR